MNPLLSIQNQSLIFFQVWRDETFRIHQCLLADILWWRLICIRPVDLDLIAKYLVVADLEGLDPRPLPLDLFQAGNPLTSVAGTFHHPIQFG